MASNRSTLETEPQNLAELMQQLGGIPPERIRYKPRPGTVTEEDAIAYNEKRIGPLCELVDGVLVEKPVGYYESLIAVIMVQRLWNHVEQHRLGIVLGADGMFRLFPGQIREPDVSFVSWARFPDGKLPRTRTLNVGLDLAVEVLSEGNTEAEMQRKRREYFAAGARQVWLVDPAKRIVSVYCSPDACQVVDESGLLSGADILPGFSLPVRELFKHDPRA